MKVLLKKKIDGINKCLENIDKNFQEHVNDTQLNEKIIKWKYYECQGYSIDAFKEENLKLHKKIYKSTKQIYRKFGHKHAVAHAYLHTHLDMFGHALITSMSSC